MSLRTQPQLRNTLFGLLVFIILGFGFYQLYQYNLFLDDDYLFSSFTGTDHPITSIKDALQSQGVAYMTWNGRFVIHTIVHMFCSIWGVGLFSILNTLMYLIFFWLIFKLTIFSKKQVFFKGFMLLIVLWFLIPIQGVTFLGNIAFSVNYLWASVAMLAFLIEYKKSSTERRFGLKSVLLLVFGVFVGSLQESFSVGIAGSLFFYYCFHLKELRGERLFLVLGFWLGTLIIVGSPGNFYRMEGEQVPMMDSGLKMLLLIKWSQLKNMLFGIPILNILLITLVLMFIRNKAYALQFLKKNQFYLVAIVINLIFALVIAYKGQWQMTSSVLFSIIMLTNLAFEKWESKIIRYRLLLVSLTGLLLIATYNSAYHVRKELYQEHQLLVQAAKEAKNGIIWSNYEVMGRTYQQRYHFIENYFRVVFYMGDKYHKRLLSTYLTKGENPDLVQCVLPFSPEKIESFCLKENQLMPSEHIYKAGTFPFFIIKANNYFNMMSSISKMNKLPENAYHKVSLKELGCEKYLYKGNLYVVIFNKSLL